jgi:hypothetical protein
MKLALAAAVLLLASAASASVGEAKPRLTLDGYKNRICGVAFSKGGKLVATGSADHTINVYAARNGRRRATLGGHTDAVRCGAEAQSGKRSRPLRSPRAGIQNQPETRIAAAEARLVREAKGSAAILAVVEPRPAALHTAACLFGTGRIFAGAHGVIVLAVPIGAPLPDVSMHVIQPVPVRFVRADLTGAP